MRHGNRLGTLAELAIYRAVSAAMFEIFLRQLIGIGKAGFFPAVALTPTPCPILFVARLTIPSSMETDSD